MIEATEVHETQITKPISVKFEHPIYTGIWIGIGLILAPIVLSGFIYLVILLIFTI